MTGIFIIFFKTNDEIVLLICKKNKISEYS